MEGEPVVTSPEVYRRVMLRCYDALFLVASLPLDELQELQNKADALGPIVDPTAWRNNRDRALEDQSVVQALRAALHAIPEHKREQVLMLGRIRAARDAAQEPTT